MKRLFVRSLMVIVSVLFSIIGEGQKKIVVIGSSTAVGVGASDRENLGWVGLLRSYYQANPVNGQNVSIVNLAVGGTNTEDGLPGTPYGITAALDLNPNIVLVNYPSNDIVAGISIGQTLINLQEIYNAAEAAHVKCFISTSQPRNFSEASLRVAQFDLKNLILASFGADALNFWDGITTTDGNYRILPEFAGNPDGDPLEPPDGTHLNNAGHMVLFNVVLDKDIFGTALPVSWKEFFAKKKGSTVELSWSTFGETNNSCFLVQRSADARHYSNIGRVAGKGNSAALSEYSFTDKSPFAGNNLYRVAQVDVDGRIEYSIIILVKEVQPPTIGEIFPSPATKSINFMIQSLKTRQLSALIYDETGRLFKKLDFIIQPGTNTINILLSDFSSGLWILKLQSSDETSIRRFIKN